jgi:pyridoxal phosphate enzyme (YggS family)
MGRIAERLASIEAEIGAAASRRRLSGPMPLLIGASKSQPPEALRQAFDAGLTRFGENRVQEALDKASRLPAEIEWHLFGPLQSNKVKKALDLFRVIHSIDRPKIAFALDREASDRGITIDAFLEINLGDEASKHGFPARGLAAAASPLAELEHLRIRGLMAIPPFADDAEESRPWFRRLRELRDELFALPDWAGGPGWLSMGMSGDYAVAIEEGATHVRVGTALFGPREGANAQLPG